MPLVVAPVGKLLRIIKILAEDKVSEKLVKMGIVVNKTITIVSSDKGRVVCMINNGKVALDSELATKIFVQEEVWNY